MIVTVLPGEARRRSPEPKAWFEVSSMYVDYCWLPVLGPTAMILAQRIDRQLEATGPVGFTVELETWAQHLGVQPGVLRKSFDRLANFGVAAWADDGTFRFARRWPELTERSMERLEPELAAWAAEELHRQKVA